MPETEFPSSKKFESASSKRSIEGSEELDPKPFVADVSTEQARFNLARALIITLIVSLAAHYIATLVLELTGHGDAANTLQPIFNSWLPVMSGFVGSAVTFYFTSDARRRP